MKEYNKYSHPKDIQVIANLMDQKFKAPGGIKFGFDSIIGLIPGFGDAIGTAISFYLLARGYTLGCSPAILKQMFINILIDHGVGMIPVVGDIFDIFWKANSKNTVLIYSHLDGIEFEDDSSKKFLVVLAIVTLIIFIGTLYLSFYVISMLFNL